MVIGRGRPIEHPKDTSEGVTWPSVTAGVAQLTVAHAYIQENPEGVKWPSVTSGSHVTTTKKKAGKKAGHAQNLLPVRPPSGQGLFRSRDWRHFRSKGHTKADIAQLPVAYAPFPVAHAQLPVAYAQNILPDTWLTSLPVMWLMSLLSLPVTWLPVAPPHSTPSNTTLSVPIYYLQRIIHDAR
jgi:hypothetical protein